jgi:hypothetical protein
VRKDVECFFGVLKGRFRILKLPIQYQDEKRVDTLFHACCILHNMLLEWRGLDRFEGTTQWAGSAGYHDAFARANTQEDLTRMGLAPVPRPVRELGHAELRAKLVRHIAVQEEAGELAWLRS